jgi:hypothetical protein
MVGKWIKDVPFSKHRKYYIALKICVLIAAALLAFKLLT